MPKFFTSSLTHVYAQSKLTLAEVLISIVRR